jgi:amino acid permease
MARSDIRVGVSTKIGSKFVQRFWKSTCSVPAVYYPYAAPNENSHTCFLSSLGTFVFTFVSQHTAHLAFGSLKPELRTVDNWKKVSTYSILISGTVSLAVGVFVYMSFWEATESDIFEIYPAIPSIDLAKLLLCITMLLTFPLPFFTCRELVIVLLWPCSNDEESVASTDDDLQEPLLQEDDASNGDELDRSMSVTDLSVLSAQVMDVYHSFLLPGEERQLILPLHIIITVKLWIVITGLAIVAPSLGDVLDLVGCATGTLIAFILPSCLALRLQGYSHLAAIILIIGAVVGVVGTTYSLKKLGTDVL